MSEREIKVGSVWANGNGEVTVTTITKPPCVQVSYSGVGEAVLAMPGELFRATHRWVRDPVELPKYVRRDFGKCPPLWVYGSPKRTTDAMSITARQIDKGRYLLRLGESLIKVEVAFGFESFGISLELGDDEGIHFYIKFGLAIYLTFSLTFLRRFERWWRERFGERTYSLRAFDGSIWWDFHQKSMEWSCRDKWWQRQVFHVKDWLIGTAKYQSELISSHRVELPFPEGSYTWDIEMRRDTWTRPRWWRETIIRCHSKCVEGTPSGYKGPTYGLTCPARNVYEAVGEITGDIYKSRGHFNPQNRRD